MQRFFCKLITPWRAERYFSAPEAFAAFLRRASRVLSALRLIVLGVATLAMLVRIFTERRAMDYVLAGGFAVILLLSLGLIQIEKQLTQQEETR